MKKQFIPMAAIVLMSLGGIAVLQTPQSAIAQSTPQPSAPQQSTPSTRRITQFTNPIEAAVLAQLNLTPDQKQKIQSINDTYQSQMSQITQAMRQTSQEYRQMMSGDTATDAQLREKHRQLQEASQQMGNVGFERELAVRNVLTPEQRKQKAAIMSDRTKMREIFQQVFHDNKPMTPSTPTPQK